MNPILKEILTLKYKNLALECENILKSLKGYEDSEVYIKTCLLLNDIYLKLEYIKYE